MLIVGLTGGIGSGKSTVADLFAQHGATVIDADVIAREVVEPGEIGFDAIKARFGRVILGVDGHIDRKRLAALVFSDDDALEDLNGIVHPLVRDEIRQRLDNWRSTDEIVVLMVPLLIESKHYKVDVLVVVDVDEETAVERVVSQRGWSVKDVRARIATQATREQRRAVADVVIDNSGSADELRQQIDEVWKQINNAAKRPSV